jgi:hypothetical protein
MLARADRLEAGLVELALEPRQRDEVERDPCAQPPAQAVRLLARHGEAAGRDARAGRRDARHLGERAREVQDLGTRMAAPALGFGWGRRAAHR